MANYPSGRLVRAGGIVTMRQQTQTAKGVVFVTLEGLPFGMGAHAIGIVQTTLHRLNLPAFISWTRNLGSRRTHGRVHSFVIALRTRNFLIDQRAIAGYAGQKYRQTKKDGSAQGKPPTR